MNWILVVLLFTIITITIGFLIKNSRDLAKSENEVQSIDKLISNTGFDESKVVDTKTEKDPTTGETTVTSTDAAGKQMSVTTTPDGSKTSSTVKDKDGTPLGSTQSSAAGQIQSIAPVLLQNIAAGVARDLVIIGGTKLITRVSKQVSENGVKSALQQGGKLVARSGPDQAMKFLGYMTKEGADRAAGAAAEKGLRKAAKEAADKVLQDELKRLGKKSLDEVTDRATKEAVEKAMEKAGKEAAEKAASEAAQKVASKAVTTATEKAAAKLAGAAAAKIGAKAGMAAAKIGAKAGMGPVGWALMAFDAISLALDVACCGGYCEVADTKTWEKQKTTFDGQVKALVDDANADGEPDPVRWPVITGPFDNLDSAALQQRVIEKVKTAMADSNNSIVKATIDKLKAAITAKTVTTESDIDAFMDANLDLDALVFEATKNLCTDLLGKSVIDDGKFAGCSWPDQNKCEASFTWGDGKFNKDTSIYASWNKDKQECNKDPVAQNMRIVCDGAGFPFNKDKKICDLSKDYCLKKGLQWDGTNCKLGKGQELAEMMFGTTVVRGLNSLYSADQYEPCPAGSRPAGEIAALAVAGCGIATFGIGAGACAATAGTYIGQTTCSSDKCPTGQDRVSGLCYDACKPGFDDKSDGITGMKVQGMCYKCPEGFKKTTAGMCQRDSCDPNLERGAQGTAGVGLCYPKCTDKFGAEYTDSNGMNLCLKGCPVGTRTEPLTCMRDVQIKRSAEAVKTCPPGWSKTVEGPGGMCRQDCTDGYKEYGGLCYHPNVNTGLLSKVPSYSCPSGSTNTGLLCTEPLKCTTDWCPSKKKQGCCSGPFWYICNTAKSTCTGGGTTPASASCPDGYSLKVGMCYAVSKPVPQSKTLIEVGQCNDATKTEAAGGMCYEPCSKFGGSFQRSGPGECRMDAQSTSRDPKDRGAGTPFIKVQAAEQYAREPNGISYKVFPKKRKIPFGKGPNGC